MPMHGYAWAWRGLLLTRCWGITYSRFLRDNPNKGKLWRIMGMVRNGFAIVGARGAHRVSVLSTAYPCYHFDSMDKRTAKGSLT